MRKTVMFLAVIGFSLGSVFTALAQSNASTSGTVTLESKSVAIGVGVSWGDGVLEYHGKKYPFAINGLSVVDLGVSKVTARGVVKNLKKLEDFNGNYVSAGAGAAVGGGAGVAALKNQNGVELALHATAKGIRLALPAAGVDIKLKQ